MDERAHIEEDPAEVSSSPAEAGARRLFVCVRDAGSGGHDFPTRLEAGLRAALDLLAREPGLARLLTVDRRLVGSGQEGDLDAERRWLRRLGRLLDEAAGADPRCTPPPFPCGPFLVGGVRFLIGRTLSGGAASELPRLLPDLLEIILAYYFEPGVPERLATGASGLDH